MSLADPASSNQNEKQILILLLNIQLIPYQGNKEKAQIIRECSRLNINQLIASNGGRGSHYIVTIIYKGRGLGHLQRHLPQQIDFSPLRGASLSQLALIPVFGFVSPRTT